jgi:serine/threonine-protein kinase
MQTPAYAAPEAMDGELPTPQSDQASLGYVLIELLTGRRLFPRGATRSEIQKAKYDLPNRLKTLLPHYVVSCSRLLSLCARLISPDPRKRFPTASDADLDTECGAAEFLHELVRGRLASVYDSDIRRWLDAVSSDI